jgi:hypothetical protein
MNVAVGSIIESNWSTGPYRVLKMEYCNEDDCFIYHHSDCAHEEHYHLTLLDADHRANSWINGMRLDGTSVWCPGDAVTVLPESAFPPNPKQKTKPAEIQQLELFA